LCSQTNLAKYINGTLKDKFGLDTTAKAKPVAGPDDLLLLLVQHWARDQSIFPTEDDRHDVATIMLFQSYTGGRPAEFVHSSKGKAADDPLGEAKTDKDMRPRELTNHGWDDKSDTEDANGYDDDYEGHPDSGYGTDGTDTTTAEDINDGCAIGIGRSGESILQPCTGVKHDEFGEAIRQYKALCYEDICVWIVQNPRPGGRDLLAMEVLLRHHKGVDNKPKPYVTPYHFRSPG
jgi:hypothetical protein